MPPAQYTPEQIEQIRRSNKKKLMWGLVCLIGPTALITVSIVIYAIVGFVASTSTSTTNSLSNEPSVAHVIMNLLMFIVGGIAILTWLPGIVVGIILLANRKQV